ncbi:PREDICTED: venom dipeptidyl peptidase 4 [Nicrophorus vespilloides]|uniref:Venom dipeptidyl peptidase 4 n=1 Tax=Nicrophorus vespilloides TaxID=110193 RepID=A0ABM1ND73_NICVS|nr:PREDICTED: venom dipeptidyl peptidase 4 [Nicrophorus vespilloides]
MTTMNQSNGSSSFEIAQSNQDLIISKGKRKKRVWIVAGLIVLIACAIAVAAFILLKQEGKGNTLGLSRNIPAITLEDFLEGKLGPHSFNATWISGNDLIYRDLLGSIVKYNVVKRSITELLPSSSKILLTAFDYEISPDHRYLLIAHDYQKLYRHSYVAQYTIVDLETGGTNPVLANNEHVLQYATWGPIENSIIYVARYNIFYRATAELEDYRVVTTDGLHGHIYNGIPDWVYEEEVFSSNKAVWFSPDGKKLAYAKFNDSIVPIMSIPVYGQPGNLDFQYPKGVQIRYPKPGTKNPDVSLHVVDFTGNIEDIELEAPKKFSEPILAAVSWASQDVVCAIWMNRIQNEADIVIYYTNTKPPKSETVKQIKEPRGWLELFTAPKFSKDGGRMILILSQTQSDAAGSFRHITMLPRNVDAQPEAITKGNFVVTEILSWDEDNEIIYYLANTEHDPGMQHVYSISLKTRVVKCMSCGVRKVSGARSECLYNSAIFSKDKSHYVLQCLGPGIPEVSVFNTTNQRLVTWEENEELTELVNDKAIPIIKRFSFNVAGGFKAQVSLKLPPNMDMSGSTKYPMLVNVYGGPDSYQIIERFGLDWGSYLAANKSIIYALIDARGSGLKGDNMLFSVYRQLGTVEIIDQINVTRQIQEALPYVDSSRTAIWGWSYGGYAAGMALANDSGNVFKCGISVAPVTDWALYDSIYTERFMDIPARNTKGYVNAQLLNKYEGLRNKQYYLVHGTLDDNVHYQQSMLWSRVLEERDIMFRQQSYTDEDHGLGSVRPHLYHSLENFLDECFVVEK